MIATARRRVVLFSEVNSKLGAPFLSILAAHPLFDLVGVVTSPPGRLCPYFVGEEDQVDLADAAAARDVPLFRAPKVNAPEVVRALGGLRPDYFVIGNYQQILRPELLAVPAVTTVNFHPSPLPRYAGWAPFFWMVRNGERDSGVTAIDVTPEIDGGPVIMRKPIRLSGRETALEVRESHTVANVALLRLLLPRLAAGDHPTVAQRPEQRTYFGKPTDHDYWLDLGRPGESVERTVLAGYRRPGAYVWTEDGTPLTVLSVEDTGTTVLPPGTPGQVRTHRGGVFVACADGWLRLWSVDVAGEEVAAPPLPATTRLSTTFRPRVESDRSAQVPVAH